MRMELAAALTTGLEGVRASPLDGGRVELIVARPAKGARDVLDEATLDVVGGLMGDSWSQRPSSRTPDGSPHPLMQVTMMNSRVAAVVADSVARWPLAGDQLYVDLDLSEQNLPAGTQVALGTAVLEITDQPHRGCAKFGHQFGQDAVRFVNAKAAAGMRLRGVNTRVLTSGTVRPGDTIRKLHP